MAYSVTVGLVLVVVVVVVAALLAAFPFAFGLFGEQFLHALLFWLIEIKEAKKKQLVSLLKLKMFLADAIRMCRGL